MLKRTTQLVRSPAMYSLAGRGIQYATQLAMVLLIPKALIPETYVQLGLVLPLALLGVSLVFGWFSTSIHRHVYDLLDPEDSKVRQMTCFYYGCIILIMVVIFLTASAWTISIYRLVPLLLVAAGLKNGILRILNASGKYIGFLYANLGFALSLAVFIWLCFLSPDQNLDLHLSIYAILDLSLALILWVMLGVFRVHPTPRFDTGLAHKYLAYGLPMMANAMAVWVISLSDRYLLTLWESADTVASYILSYQLGGSAITIPLSFMATVIYPRILKLDKEAGEASALAWTYRLLRRYMLLTPLIFASACAIVLPFKYYVYPAYAFNPEVMVIIILAHVIYGLSHFYNKEFELNGKTLEITKAVGAGAIVNLGLNVLLIPLIGATGAALSTLAAYSLTVFLVRRTGKYKLQ